MNGKIETKLYRFQVALCRFLTSYNGSQWVSVFIDESKRLDKGDDENYGVKAMTKTMAKAT
jgi:hypothetical protein